MKTKKVDGLLKQSKKGYTVTLSKELPDRDSETVMIDGIDITYFQKNPVLLDAHNMGGSIVDNVLGKVVNPRKEIDSDGVKVLRGELEFASTPRALIAKSLVDGGFVKTTSIGFRVFDFDRKSGEIPKSELYELSLVSVPANVYAEIGSKGVKTEDVGSELVKKLKNYDMIHPVIKEYRKLFMSSKLTDLLSYEKTGDETKDIIGIFNAIKSIIDASTEENPTVAAETVENPQSQAELRKELKELIKSNNLY